MCSKTGAALSTTTPSLNIYTRERQECPLRLILRILIHSIRDQLTIIKEGLKKNKELVKRSKTVSVQIQDHSKRWKRSSSLVLSGSSKYRNRTPLKSPRMTAYLLSSTALVVWRILTEASKTHLPHQKLKQTPDSS